MSSQVKELELGDYVNLIKRRWRWIAATFVVGVVLVAAFTFTRDEAYRSRADILVLTDNSTGQFTFDPEVEDRLVRNSIAELQVMNSQQFIVSAEQTLGYEPNVNFDLLGSVTGRAEDSSVIRVTSSESTPERAAASAQTFSELYVAQRTAGDLRDITEGRDLALELREDLDARRVALRAPVLELRADRNASLDPAVIQELTTQIDEIEADTAGALNSINQQIGAVNADLVLLEQAIASLETGNSATILINDAFLPSAPSSPNVPRNLLLGAVAALLLGFFLATLRELLDSGAGDATELATLAETPIIASVPTLKSARSEPGGVMPFAELSHDQSSPYRALLDSVWLSQNGSPVSSVAVTAVGVGQGGTQTSVNLAQAEARRGAAVCIVDADFARPGVAERLGLSRPDLGLADLLADRCIIDDVITPTEVSGLDLVGAGGVDRATPDHLRSTRLGDLLAELIERYEFVVVDTPSISGLVDSRTIASQCDATVVVYDEGRSKRDDVVDAVEILRAARANPVGLVSNRSYTRRQIHLADG